MSRSPDPVRGAAADEREAADELLGVLSEGARLDHRTRIELGRGLLAAQRAAAESPDGWTIFGVTSFGQLCEQRLNLPAIAGIQMRAAAWAAERSPELAQRLEDGRLNVAKSAAVAQVLDYVQGAGKELDLLLLAEHGTLRETRREVDRLKEEARTQQPLVPVTLHLTRPALADLERARDLLTDGRGGPRTTASHAVSVALEEFVDRRCPERKAARAEERALRRQARAATREPAARSSSPADLPTEAGRGPAPAADSHGDEVAALAAAAPSPSERTGTRRSRAIPAADRHELIRAHGDRCWVSGCENRASLQFAHLEPFRLGGANAWWNLARVCLDHHRLLDSGQVKLRPTAKGVLLVDRRGQIVGRVRGPPE